MSGRDAVLGAVRSALARDDPAGAPAAPPRGYRRRGELPPGGAAVVELMVDRLGDYRAVVHRCEAADAPAVVDGALRTSRSVVIPPGLPAALADACRAGGRTVVTDADPEPLSAHALDGIDAVVTRAAVGIAVSGTIVLDGGQDQGRRAITLLPDHHVVVLDAAQIVQTVPEGIALLEPTRPLTMISGPSATSDIELERVEGVHGPRTLEVVIVG